MIFITERILIVASQKIFVEISLGQILGESKVTYEREQHSATPSSDQAWEHEQHWASCASGEHRHTTNDNRKSDASVHYVGSVLTPLHIDLIHIKGCGENLSREVRGTYMWYVKYVVHTCCTWSTWYIHVVREVRGTYMWYVKYVVHTWGTWSTWCSVRFLVSNTSMNSVSWEWFVMLLYNVFSTCGGSMKTKRSIRYNAAPYITANGIPANLKRKVIWYLYLFVSSPQLPTKSRHRVCYSRT